MLKSESEMNPYGFIYKTMLPDGRYYIGQHKIANQMTRDPSYYGSGVIIKDYIKSKGAAGLKREILEYGNSHNEMNDLEIKYITEEVLNDPLSLNLDFGGRNKSRCEAAKTQIGKSISKLRKEQPWRWPARTSSNNPSSARWRIISPAGVEYEIIGSIAEFCLQHGLSANTLVIASRQGWIPRRGKCSGWRIFNLTTGKGTIRETRNHGEARSGVNNPSHKSRRTPANL